MSNLSIEACIERLANAIDPIPPQAERVRSGSQTTYAPQPLPAAGRRTTGFGYAAGTRPVVGAITDRQFRLEKRVVTAWYGSRWSGKLIIAARCTGRLSPLAHGTLIEMDMRRPTSSLVSLVGVGLIALFVALLGSCLLPVFLSGQADRKEILGFCVIVLIFVVLLGAFGVMSQTSQTDRAYLLRFVEQVCEATLLEGPAPHERTAYTDETRRLP
jgi:hypothetical protein